VMTTPPRRPDEDDDSPVIGNDAGLDVGEGGRHQVHRRRCRPCQAVVRRAGLLRRSVPARHIRGGRGIGLRGRQWREQEEGGGCNEDNNERRRATTRNLPCRDHRHHHCSHLRRRGAKDDQSGTKPMICRGTHARVMSMERAIDAFLSLDAPPSSSSSPSSSFEGKEEEGRCRGQIRRRRQDDAASSSYLSDYYLVGHNL
jgi:hypothetical protein